jgi:hypothetical protein
MRPTLVLIVAFMLGACGRVRPHERQQLAHPAMQAPVWPEIERGDRHVFAIREGTEAASLEGGGGCGCN